MRLLLLFFLSAALSLLIKSAIYGQQTNPVDRDVTNPITDTRSVNPLTNENLLPPPPAKKQEFPSAGELSVESDKQTATGTEKNRVFVNEGNVDVKLGVYRLQADKVTVYEAENRVVAEGSVVFDQGADQRITGTKAEWNYKTKLGYFVNSTGFTNQTDDGTILFFTAERVERTSLDTIVITEGKITACGDDLVPKWSFTTKRIEIKTGDRAKLKSPTFRVLNVPVFKLPFATIPLKKNDRQSGFLTPTFGAGGAKGFRLSTAYYQTLGKSADLTLRTDIYTSRGLGFGFDVRTRSNERSYLNFGFFAVKDRIFGNRNLPNQGGTSFYADGVQYFPNGFTAVVDVKLTSNLAFRQVFSDRIQQVISPIEVSQVFINKSRNNYSLDFLARSQQISLPDVIVSTKNLPSVYFEKRPGLISFFKRLPVYFSFCSSVEGVSRRESQDRSQVARSEIQRTPALGQRLDFNPQIEIPLSFKGFNFTTTAGLRTTYYSNSQDFVTRQISPRDYIRGYGEIEFDFRPPALARNYYAKDGLFLFRHVVEPYIAFRARGGIGRQFRRTILFDYNDTVTDTREIEYGLTNRFYTRRYTEIPAEGVSREILRRISENPSSQLSIQPYEIFTLTIRGKYFADPYFGGALFPGRRNQFASMTDLSAFSFGGVPRRFSPVNVDATYRPRRTIFFNSRMDLGVDKLNLRDLSATVGYDTRLVRIFQTFYYTRAVNLIPSLARFADSAGKEPGTRRGSQWSPTIFAGNRERGIYGGASLFFDFQNRRALNASPLISSTFTLGYAFNCCALTAQYQSFNVGLRNENRVLFSFRLNGIGAFGTEQFGQALR
jgi:LPS-assembly protein